jgi:acyl-CoA thioesterase YciA
MDKIVFHQPVFVGDVLSLYAEAQRVGRTSMTIKVRVCARRRDQPDTTVNVTEAEVVFVALGDDGKPAAIFE